MSILLEKNDQIAHFMTFSLTLDIIFPFRLTPIEKCWTENLLVLFYFYSFDISLQQKWSKQWPVNSFELTLWGGRTLLIRRTDFKTSIQRCDSWWSITRHRMSVANTPRMLSRVSLFRWISFLKECTMFTMSCLPMGQAWAFSGKDDMRWTICRWKDKKSTTKGSFKSKPEANQKKDPDHCCYWKLKALLWIL